MGTPFFSHPRGKKTHNYVFSYIEIHLDESRSLPCSQSAENATTVPLRLTLDLACFCLVLPSSFSVRSIPTPNPSNPESTGFPGIPGQIPPESISVNSAPAYSPSPVRSPWFANSRMSTPPLVEAFYRR